MHDAVFARLRGPLPRTVLSHRHMLDMSLRIRGSGCWERSSECCLCTLLVGTFCTVASPPTAHSLSADLGCKPSWHRSQRGLHPGHWAWNRWESVAISPAHVMT